MAIRVEDIGDKKLVTVCTHDSGTGAGSPLPPCPEMGPQECWSGQGDKTVSVARNTDREMLGGPWPAGCHVSPVCLLITASPGGKASTLF